MNARVTLIVTLIAATALAPVVEAGPFPTWDKPLKGAGRFKVLSSFGGEAVQDKETGLVWQLTPMNVALPWATAAKICYEIQVGTRKGWRLPTIEELMSLADPSQSPALPAGHPFDGVLTGLGDSYWSSTTVPGDATDALAVAFANGGLVTASKSSTEPRFWCVRGAQGTDGQ